MRTLIYEEFKKVMKQEHLLIVLVTLILVTLFYNGRVLRNGSLYKQHSALFEGVNINEVSSILDTSSMNRDEKEFISYLVGEQVNYSRDFYDKNNAMIEAAQDNVLDQNMNKKGIALSNYIIDKYQYRSIDRFKEPESWTRYFINNFATFSSLIFLSFIASQMYSKEKETSVISLQKSTKNNKKIVYAKSMALFIVSLITLVIFELITLYNFSSRLGMGDITAPLFALPRYMATPVNITIGGFFSLRFILNVVGIWMFSLLFSYISMMTKRSLLAFVMSFALIMIVNNLAPMPYGYLNPYSIFSSAHTFETFNYLVVAGFVVLTPYITLGIVLGLCLTLVYLTQKTYLKGWY